MTRRDRERLEGALAELDPATRKALHRRAHQLRKAARAAERLGPEVEEEEDEPVAGPRRASETALAGWLLLALDERAAEASDGPPDGSPTTAGRPALVLSAESGGCLVWHEGREVRCTLPSHIARRQQSMLAPGDAVTLDFRGDDTVWVVGVLPRRSALDRPDPGTGARRVLAANIDVAVIVASVVAPPLRPEWVDRVVVAVRRGEAEPLVCVNKIDLLPDPDARIAALAPLAAHRAAGVRVVACSAQTGEGVPALAEALSGRLCVLVGHSGTGKSSLLNALCPGADARVGAVRAADGTGKHTTTSSMLHELPGGARVIDTPGVRVFGLPELDEFERAELFPVIAELARDCRFSDCAHLHEPGCAVRAAVEDGRLPREVYERYAQLA